MSSLDFVFSNINGLSLSLYFWVLSPSRLKSWIIFIINTLYIDWTFQLNENLVDTLSNIMQTDVTLLQDAQRISKACSRFVSWSFLSLFIIVIHHSHSWCLCLLLSSKLLMLVVIYKTIILPRGVNLIWKKIIVVCTCRFEVKIDFCIAFAVYSMVINLNLLATRFPMDLLSDMAFLSKNIAVYVVQISQIELAGKMCYVTTRKDSSLKDIDCLPCIYNTSCKKQMVCIHPTLCWTASIVNICFCFDSVAKERGR